MDNVEHSVKDPLEYARTVVGGDPWAVYLGIEVEEVRQGYARCSLTVRPDYLNAVERAHGAVIYALADQAFAVGSNSTGVMALALEFSIHYLGPARDGEKIFAEAKPVNIGKKVSTWDVEVRGSEDRIVAVGRGVAYHK